MAHADLNTVRELEDLIIDCIYNELVEGKLDQLNKKFHVVSCYGRDMRPSDIDSALSKLEAWDRQLQEAQNFIENRIVKGCNQSVVENYERQLKEIENMEQRREEVIQEMHSGKKKGGKQGG